jgi:hypothetical protein
MNNFKYFNASLIVTLIGLMLAFTIGGPSALFVVAVLCVMEISLSFDNAIVNAKVLEDMSEIWRKRFLTWGMLIAVFGMRILFPLAIVSIIAGINPIAALQLAMNNPEQYAHHMEASNVALMGFGGAFLMMVGAGFFFDNEKDEHWIHFIENKLTNAPLISAAPHALTSIAVLLTALIQKNQHDSIVLALAGLGGIILHFSLGQLSGWMESKEDARKSNLAVGAAKGGAAMFIYLEILDASFSFDGVIGAFAITNKIFIIAIGLGIGAMFVRSLTIMFVEKGTLSQYKYLEHGAFYAIAALSVIMLLKSVIEVPELITGIIGAVFIGMAFIHSLMAMKQDESQQAI